MKYLNKVENPLTSDDINSSPSGKQQPILPVTPPIPNIPKRKISFKLYIIAFLLLVCIIFSGIYVYSNQKGEKIVTQSKIIQQKAEQQNFEIATHSYYKNNKSFQVIKEESKKYPNGEMETITMSNGEKLSHQLFLKDKIISLQNGFLTEQIFKSSEKQPTYLTTAESFLNIIKQNPQLPKKAVTLNGKKMVVYIINDKKNTFNFVKQSYAQTLAPFTTNIFVSDKGELVKVENIDSSTNQVTEDIAFEGKDVNPTPTSIAEVYTPPIESSVPATSSPALPPIASDAASPTPFVTLFPSESPLEPIEDQLKKEAQDSKTIKYDTPVPYVPTTNPITIFPLSIIPQDSQYNNLFLEVASNVFQISEMEVKSLKEKSIFDPEEFVKNNIRVRIDGTEIPYQNFNITVDTFNPFDDKKDMGFVRFQIPSGLQPGLHTVEIFAINTWYLAPSFMVTLPTAGEKILNIDTHTQMSPIATSTSTGHSITLHGENIVKPFSVTLTDTQGQRIEVKDNDVVVEGTDTLILNVPDSGVKGIYSLTIVKNGQTVYRPNFLAF